MEAACSKDPGPDVEADYGNSEAHAAHVEGRGGDVLRGRQVAPAQLRTVAHTATQSSAKENTVQ